MQLDSHPIAMVPCWVNALGGDWLATFSRYCYMPQTVGEIRQRFRVPLVEVTEGWFEKQLEDLPGGYELAMDSTLCWGARRRHVPMVDFAAQVMGRGEILDWANKHLGLCLTLFDSGRSYHAYGTEPITSRHWIRLMGLLLLANLPDRPPIVDSRWIGHRLLAGYASLRWTRNTDHYLSVPNRV
jgi:hypothetical protein